MSEGISTLEKVEAVLRNPAVYELAELIPKQKRKGGRQRAFPEYMLFVYDALQSVYGSSRKVEAELKHPYVWKYMRKIVKKMWPNDSSKWLPSRRYRRHHYEYGRNKYLTNPEILDQVKQVHRQFATQQARELGLMQDDGSSFTHPSADRMIYADGKVITPLYKARPGTEVVNKQTGEIRSVRFDADADLHYQGDGEMAWGVKFVLTAARTESINERIILDIDWVKTKGSEAKTAMSSFRNLAPQLPDAQGVIYDTALRGVHHQELLRNLGWLSINRVQAKSLSRPSGKARRTEKMVHIEDRLVGNKTVKLFTCGGALGIAAYTDTGEMRFERLKRTRTIRKQDKNGLFRWYNEYVLPTGESILVRLDATDEDRKRKLNRTENLRPIPPGDADFERLYRRRNDIESINRAVDDSLWLGRAHSKGHARQTIDLIGYALMVNGLAIQLARKRKDELLAA